MTEYVTISEAKNSEKGGNIIAKVISVNDITNGNSLKGPWKRQETTLQDNSGTTKFTMWNNDTNSVVLNQSYKMEGLFWKEYNNELYPQMGQYTKLKIASPDDFVNSATNDVGPLTQPLSPNISSLPKLEQHVENIIQTKAIELLEIEEQVITILNKYSPNESKNGQKIGMMTKTIFLFLNQKANA